MGRPDDHTEIDVGGEDHHGLVALARAADSDVHTLATILEQLGIAACIYDAGDRVVLWNETYLQFFPEQVGTLTKGIPYADTLRRFFASNLDENEQGTLDRHVKAGVARHRSQRMPFVFQRKSGRWLKVASLPLGGGGRVRVWRDVTGEQADATRPSSAQAAAALDVGYAVFDAAGGFLSANKRYQELFPGLGDLIHVGSRYGDHLRRVATDVLTEAPRQMLLRAAERVIPADEPFGLPLLLESQDGSWLNLQERFGDDGALVAIWTDATHQAEAQAEIDRLQIRLRDAIESIPHGLLLFGEDGRLAFSNRRLSIIDHALSDLMNDSATMADFKVWHTEHRDGLSKTHQHPLTGVRSEELSLPGDRTILVETFQTSGGDTLILFNDVSEQRRVSAEIERQREVAHQSEKMAALGSLLAGVAHELNNPLSVVIGRAMMLRESVGDPQHVAALNALSTAAERCVKVVRSFLALARQKPVGRKRVALDRELASVITMLEYAFRTADIEVRIADIPPSAVIDAEEDALNKLLVNLLVNAQHALEESPKPRTIDVSAQVRDGQVAIAVADNGPGVPEDLRMRVFEPFFTTKPQGVGTGIGLSVCHSIVSSHGGDIDVVEGPSGGAQFVVTLPLANGESSADRDDGVEPARSDGEILLVEDEGDLADMLRELLVGQGFAVTCVGDGAAALERLRVYSYGLLITDLRMPGLDGREMLRELAGWSSHEVPPVLVVTGDTLGLRSATLGITPIDVIEKPIDLKLFLATVRDHFDS
ncbi:MAG: PAS-domain containing protein [Pseudomonadota bacterium]